jgi:hypothetical protein
VDWRNNCVHRTLIGSVSESTECMNSILIAKLISHNVVSYLLMRLSDIQNRCNKTAGSTFELECVTQFEAATVCF